MKLLFVWPNKDSFGFKPIGLSLLSAIAKRQGWEVKLFDTTGIDLGFVDNTVSGESARIFKPVDLSSYHLNKDKIDLDAAFTGVLEDFKPDCLALTVLSDEFLIAARITKGAKRINPRLPVIWGGKYPTLNPEKTLTVHQADFACIGEGLDAFGEFLAGLNGKNGLYAIPNVWGKKNDRIVKNKLRPLKASLDDLPFVDWDIFDKRQFVKPFDGKVYVGGDHMSNWGCPYHCTYCINHFYHSLYDNKYTMRRYGTSRVVKELKSLKDKYKLEILRFHDEDFLMRPAENLAEFAQSYKDEVGLPFMIETNPKSVIAEKVRLLKEMNCVSASVAIESGDLQLRKKLLNRVDSEDDIVRAFSLFKDFGIRTSSFNLLGVPYETRETFMHTVKLNRKAGAQYPSIGFFFPFEGTVLRDEAVKGGFFDPDPGDRVYRHDRPSLVFKDLKEQELIEMRNVFVLYVKLPEPFWPFIKRSEGLDPVGVRLRKKILEIYEETVWSNNGWYKGTNREAEFLRELKALSAEEKICA
ncbi:MAG: radical SAM protein [Candidatus Omnitrophica bacterium]|nr:radical SAM protein [Candidatus Omnitrophota bacterium]